MKFAVEWSFLGERDLLDLPWRSAARIAREVLHFAETGEGLVRRVKDATDAPFRLVVAPYEVRFSVDREARLLVVWRVFKK
jgi:hypothetical protein